eukprot:m.89130 g.89130  ORF g.89130 m.89130 type:complete len:229 (-) comp16437_c0_seq7:1168-1854(-)
MQRTPQFVTGDFQPHHCFLPAEVYGQALDSIVKACSDVLITSGNGKRVFLGKRKVEPQPDWWYIGGRVKPGDTPQSGAARNVKRELGLDLDPNRFKIIANYSLVWSRRVQTPVENGTADISTIHRLELQDEGEVAACILDIKEYSDAKWFDTNAVLAGDFHPALKQAIRDMRADMAFGVLQELVYSESASNDDIAAAARDLVTVTEGCKLSPTKVRFKDGRYTEAEGD